MFNSNFIQKSSVNFKQPIGKNIASAFTKMSHPVSLNQSYDSPCSQTTKQIVTCITNTMSTPTTNVFGKRPIVNPTSIGTLKKNPISVPNSNIHFLKSLNTNSPLLSCCEKTVKCNANSISFPINTMQQSC